MRKDATHEKRKADDGEHQKRPVGNHLVRIEYRRGLEISVHNTDIFTTLCFKKKPTWRTCTRASISSLTAVLKRERVQKRGGTLASRQRLYNNLKGVTLC